MEEVLPIPASVDQSRARGGQRRVSALHPSALHLHRRRKLKTARRRHRCLTHTRSLFKLSSLALPVIGVALCSVLADHPLQRRHHSPLAVSVATSAHRGDSESFERSLLFAKK
jgi:hypothetical protein